MLQDLVNYLAPIAALLALLGFNDARLAHKRSAADSRRLAENEGRCNRLTTELEDRERTIAHLTQELASGPPSAEPGPSEPIPEFASVEHEGMAYFVAGDRVLRARIREDGLFLLSDAVPADPITCDDIDPGVLLEITMNLGR